MNDRTQQPYWAFLYASILRQTEPEELKKHLHQLEDAMWERLLELERDPSPYVERAAIQSAAEKLLEIKIKKLGFPSIGIDPSQPAAAA